MFHFFSPEFCPSENMIFIFLPFLANALNVTGHGKTDVQGRFWETTYDCEGKNVKILVTMALQNVDVLVVLDFSSFWGFGVNLTAHEKRVKSKADGLGSKWTVLWGKTGRSKRLKLNGYESNWAVQKTNSERSAKVEGHEIQKWTVHFGLNNRLV